MISPKNNNSRQVVHIWNEGYEKKSELYILLCNLKFIKPQKHMDFSSVKLREATGWEYLIRDIWRSRRTTSQFHISHSRFTQVFLKTIFSNSKKFHDQPFRIFRGSTISSRFVMKLSFYYPTISFLLKLFF